MKFEKILHCVQDSYEVPPLCYGDSPSFVILMSDGKEYISNGSMWLENTEETRGYLIGEYYCEDGLENLLQAPPIEMKDVVDAREMFQYSGITEFSADMSSVVFAEAMFRSSGLVEFNADMSNVVTADWMFSYSNLTKFNADTSSIKASDSWYIFCNTPYGKTLRKNLAEKPCGKPPATHLTETNYEI